MAKRHEERIRFGNDELLAQGNLDAIAEVFTTDYVVHAGGKDYSGHQFIRRFVKQTRAAIPNLRVVDITVLSNTKGTVTWERTLSGTHKEPLRGIPASGKKITWHDMVVSRFEGSLIAEEWTVSDLAGQMMLKLG